MKKKILAFALCLVMLFSLCFLGCEEEEQAPTPPAQQKPVTLSSESLFNYISFLDEKQDASKIKTWEFDDEQDFSVLNNYFIGSIKKIYDTTDTSKLLSTEYKISNIYNDNVISATTNDAIEETDPAYATTLVAVEPMPLGDGDFVMIAFIYGNKSVDVHLYNKYCVKVAEEKGLSSDSDPSDILDFDSNFNDNAIYYDTRYISFLKKIFIVNDDFTISPVIDFNKNNFNLDEVRYIKEIGKFISIDDTFDNDVANKVYIFDSTLKIESAYEFAYSLNAEEIYTFFLDYTTAIYTEIIPLADDATEYDAVYYGRKIDIKITKFDFLTGTATDMPVGGFVLNSHNWGYENLNEVSEYLGISFNMDFYVSAFLRIENKILFEETRFLAFDANLTPLKYLEMPIGSTEAMPATLANGQKILITEFGAYKLNDDLTVGELIDIDRDYNELWSIVDEEKIYDNKGNLIYTLPEGRSIEHILNNSLIIKEEVREEGALVCVRYFLWKGPNNESKIGDDRVLPYGPSYIPPTEGTFTQFFTIDYTNGAYATTTVDYAKIANGDESATITIYDDLGNQLLKLENVTYADDSSHSSDAASFITFEITTADADGNETVKYVVVAIVNGAPVYRGPLF